MHAEPNTSRRCESMRHMQLPLSVEARVTITTSHSKHQPEDQPVKAELSWQEEDCRQQSDLPHTLTSTQSVSLYLTPARPRYSHSMSDCSSRLLLWFTGKQTRSRTFACELQLWALAGIVHGIAVPRVCKGKSIQCILIAGA